MGCLAAKRSPTSIRKSAPAQEDAQVSAAVLALKSCSRNIRNTNRAVKSFVSGDDSGVTSRRHVLQSPLRRFQKIPHLCVRGFMPLVLIAFDLNADHPCLEPTLDITVAIADHD